MANNTSTKTIVIEVQTKKGQENVKKLGSEINKTKEKTKGYTSVLGENTAGMGKWLGILKRGLPIIGGIAGAFKILNSAIKSNTGLALLMKQAQAEVGAVFGKLTADIGAYIADLVEANDKQSWFSSFVEESGRALEKTLIELGLSADGVRKYTEEMEEAIRVARLLTEIQFRMSERLAENSVLQAEAKKTLEGFRLASRDLALTASEQLQAQKAAIVQTEVLHQLQVDGLNIRKEELEAAKLAAEGTEAKRQIDIELTKLQAARIALDTQEIQTKQTLAERLTTLTNAANAYWDSIAGVTPEVEEFNMAVFDSNEVIQQSSGVMSEWDLITSQANEKLKESIDLTNEKNATIDENTEAQSNANRAAQKGLGIAQAAADLAKEGFSAKGLFRVLASVAQFIPGFGPAISGGLNLIGGLFKDGGIINGPSHNHGGVKYALGGSVVELEGGEGVINKKSMGIPWIRDMASDLNQIGGGIKFANGGITPGTTGNNQQLIVPVLVTDDLNAVQNRTRVIEDIATI